MSRPGAEQEKRIDRPRKKWHIYVLRTRSSALYTGISTDVDGRVVAHAEGRGAKCLRGRGPLELVYRQRLGDVGLALRVERALKGLSKAQKEELATAQPTRAQLLRRLGLAPVKRPTATCAAAKPTVRSKKPAPRA